MRMRISAFVLFAILPMPGHATEPGFAARATELRARPADSAQVTGRLAKKQKIEVLARDGAWTQVRGTGGAGWVRLLDVRYDAPAGQALPAARVKPLKDNGIRGFSEEDLLAGTPGNSEIGKMKAYAATAKDASGYARSAGLKPRKLDYLDPGDYLSVEQLPDDFFNE